MLEMNPEIREQWCKALRSGEYKQTTGALRRLPEPSSPPGHCCLGVLTDLYVKATGKTKTTYSYRYNGEDMDIWDDPGLPIVVMEWAGLSSDNPTLYRAGGSCATAIEWNDERGADFQQIADMIDGGQAKQG